MRRHVAAAISVAVISTASAAAADTVIQNISYSFLEGPLSGTVAEVEYSYPTPPPGEPIFGYSPEPTGAATYLDAVSEDLFNALLVFSGSGDILFPEPYLDFSFEPEANATGLSYLGVWNVAAVGLYFEGADDILIYDCGDDVDCAFSTEVAPVPLPPGLPMLIGALGLLTVAARRRV